MHIFQHHHGCRWQATNTAFMACTTLLQLSMHLAVVPEISTSWYQFPVLLRSLDRGDVDGQRPRCFRMWPVQWRFFLMKRCSIEWSPSC